MTETNSLITPESKSERTTAEVMDRFLAAFQQHDASAFVDLVAEDCVMESMQPAPNGTRYEGYETNVQFWQAMATDPNGTFEVEDVVVCGDRAIQRWRYRFGEGEEESVRGVTLLRVRNGKIIEVLAYAKTPARTNLRQDQ